MRRQWMNKRMNKKNEQKDKKKVDGDDQKSS